MDLTKNLPNHDAAFLNPLRAFASRRARPSDQTALSPIEFSTKEEDLENRVKPSMVAPKKQEEEGTLDKKERVIREKTRAFCVCSCRCHFRVRSSVLCSFCSCFNHLAKILTSLEPGSNPLGLTEEAARAVSRGTVPTYLRPNMVQRPSLSSTRLPPIRSISF